MAHGGPLEEASIELGICCLRYGRELRQRREFELAGQIIRSGTAVGALISEGVDSESIRDMLHKFGIALKEARETKYWLVLIERVDSELLPEHATATRLLDNVIPMLVASRRTLKQKLEPPNE